MRDVKCLYCEEYRNEWCEKVVDSPHPDILRDCQYFHEAKTRWIPCGERLPEEEDEYLVTLEDSTGTWTSSDDFDGEEFGFYAHKDDELIWCPVKNVVAWQPLPEPYNGGEQDG